MKELDELRSWRDQQEEARTFAEQNEQLDNVLQMMHNQHGDFDDTYVITRIAEHGDVNRAIAEFNEMVGKFSGTNSRTPRQAPVTLGGQGGVPAQQVDTTKLRGNERKALIAQMLEGQG
jgi:hypothetical protein